LEPFQGFGQAIEIAGKKKIVDRLAGPWDYTGPSRGSDPIINHPYYY